MLAVISPIEGENDQKVVSFAFEKSDAVMLVYQNPGQRAFRKSLHDIRIALRPFRLSSRCNQDKKSKKSKDGFEWPGTVSWDERSLIRADVYRLSAEVCAYIRSANALFDWIAPDRPEDIAFFKDGVCWISTTTHEQFCNVFGNERETARLLDDLGIEYERLEGFCEPYIEKYTL